MQSKDLFTVTKTAIATIPEFGPVGFDGGAPADGAKMLGLAQHGGDAGTDLPVRVLGTSQAVAGGAFDPGDPLKIAGGKLVDQAGTGVIVAEAFTGAGADGDVVEVLLR